MPGPLSRHGEEYRIRSPAKSGASWGKPGGFSGEPGRPLPPAYFLPAVKVCK